MELPYFPEFNEDILRMQVSENDPSKLTPSEIAQGYTSSLKRMRDENWAAFKPVGIVIDAPTPLKKLLTGTLDLLVWREDMFNFVDPQNPPYRETETGREFLTRHILKNFHYRQHQQEIIHALEARLRTLTGLFQSAADIIDDDGLYVVPLWELLPDPFEALDKCMGMFLSRNAGMSGALEETWMKIWANVSLSDRTKRRDGSYVKPSASGYSPAEAIKRYFKGTVFEYLFFAPATVALPRKLRYEHMHILGAQGAGKTTMLERLIGRDIEAPDEPSVVVIEPHSDLTKNLLARHIKHAERIILIDPRDTEYPPALNLFHISEERIAKYGERAREQQATAIVDTFDFLFANLLDTELTGKQSFFLRYIARLLVTLPATLGRTATLIDVMRLMEDLEPYKPAIDKLPGLQREFFEQDFNTREYKDTKDQIRYRIRAIIENPTLERLFSTEDNAIDLFEALNSGKIILIDTAKDFLKSGSSVYGRIFLSLILQAILERAAIPEGRRRPTFVYIDEAADLIDRNIDSFITEARKYKAGLILAHQRLEQAGPEFRSALAGTALKLVGGLSSADAASMAADMRTDKQWLLNLKKYRFGYFARGQLERAVDVGVLPPAEPDWPLFREVYPHFQNVNRYEISGRCEIPDEPEAPVQKQSEGKPPLEDVSDEW